MPRAKRYTVSDGKLVLTLEEATEGGYVVRSPTDPAVITQAETIRDALAMARDAIGALANSRRDPQRWQSGPRRPHRRRS